jgi:hypothetical protein
MIAAAVTTPASGSHRRPGRLSAATRTSPTTTVVMT